MGPLLPLRARLKVAAALREKGHGFFEAAQLAANLTNSDIHDAVASQPEMVAAIGDGTILKAIIDFFNSPLGKKLIDLLVSLILGA